MKHWHVLKTCPRQELWAYDNLRNIGFLAFWPRFMYERRKGMKKIQALKPVFPSYMFVAFDPDVDEWKKINRAYGVQKIIMCGDYIPFVPDAFIENMMKIARDGIMKEKDNLSVQVGDRVKIVSGPLNGLDGICQLSESSRVSILLSLLGKENRVTLTPEQVIVIKS